MNILKKIIQKSVNLLGYGLVTKANYLDPVISSDERFQEIYVKCKDYTMTSRERMYALYKAVEYIINSKTHGDFVECGVWKGGSAMLMAFILVEMKATDRKIYLYDTFKGMSEPTKDDGLLLDKSFSIIAEWKKEQRKGFNEWMFSPLTEVKNNMRLTGYPENNIIFIEGKVEDTIPKIAPSEIALLRLDTDWYESTKHELIYLFPRLVKSGVLIIDDYGCTAGSKKAVDEYFHDRPILLTRIDYAGRMGINS